MLVFYIVGILLLVALSAFFSGSESAFLSISKIQMRQYLLEKRKNATLISKLKSNMDSLLSTILVGNNFVNNSTFSMADVREIKKDEPVVLKLRILSHYEKNDVRMRCIVHGVDDSNAGMSISENSIQLKNGENFITAELDLNVLAPNGYYMNIILYAVGENGGQERIDIVDKACYFRKEYFESSTGYLNWVHSSWGNANLPKIKIIQ